MTEQLSLFDDKVVIMNRGLERLFNLDFSGAKEEFSRYAKLYHNSSDVAQEIEISNFFMKNTASIADDIPMEKKIEKFYSLWEEFHVFVDRMGYKNETVIDKLQRSYFKSLLTDIENKDLNDFLFFKDTLPIGLIYLLGGDLATATTLIQESLLKKPNSRSYAYLGDSYFLQGEIQLSRVCYREAFIFDPHHVDLERLKDPDIHKLMERLKRRTYFPLDWLPVYARLEGLFTKKVFQSFDDLRIVVEEYEMLDKVFSKDQDEVSKAALYCRAMALSDNHRMLRFIKQITIAQIRENMKRLDSRLFELYMEKIEDEVHNVND